MSFYHQPVLVQEVINGLAVKPGGKYIDATIGGGGHGIEIVKLGGILLGIDTDQEAIAFTKQKLESLDNWSLVRGNFCDIERIAVEQGFSQVDGVLFDLGVSSYQLDTPRRGFSYRFKDEKLDLRMDQSGGSTATDLLNSLSEKDLYEILARYSEEQLAGPIAHAIILGRRVKKIKLIGDLVEIVGKVAGNDKQKSAILSRVFQGLRIAVNDELKTLSQGLQGAEKILKQEGRIAVISFHSLEDRLVKKFFSSSGWQLLPKRPIVPGPWEISRNRRSRSAKLRIAEKL